MAPPPPPNAVLPETTVDELKFHQEGGIPPGGSVPLLLLEYAGEMVSCRIGWHGNITSQILTFPNSALGPTPRGNELVCPTLLDETCMEHRGAMIRLCNLVMAWGYGPISVIETRF